MFSLRNFSQKERDLMEFAESAGIIMNPRILRYCLLPFKMFLIKIYVELYLNAYNLLFRSIIELLQANTSPASIIQMISELSIIRVQEKTKRQRMLKNVIEK